MTALTSLDQSAEKSEARDPILTPDKCRLENLIIDRYLTSLDSLDSLFKVQRHTSEHQIQYQWQFFKPAEAAIHFTRLDGFQILVELIKHLFLLNRETRSGAQKGDESRNWFLCFLHENCIIYEGKVLLSGACRCSCRKATKSQSFLSLVKRCYRGIWISVRKVIKSWNNSAESIDLQAALGVFSYVTWLTTAVLLIAHCLRSTNV